MVSYNKNLFGAGSIVLGAFFLVEHIFRWNEVAFWDFIGHEWLGIVLIVFGIVLNTNWSFKRFSKEFERWLSK